MISQNNSVTMPTVKVGTKHQVVIPRNLFNELGLSVGDYLEARREEGNIVLEPQKLVPRNQSWFWTKEWQQKVKEAETDIKEDDLSPSFDKADDLINYLNTDNVDRNNTNH